MLIGVCHVAPLSVEQLNPPNSQAAEFGLEPDLL
jgi:hypothetical protein